MAAKHPWDMLPGETARAYQAFEANVSCRVGSSHSGLDYAHSGLADAEAAGNAGATLSGSQRVADSANSRGGYRSARSATLRHLGHVLGVTAGGEVGWVTAGRVITRVQNVEPARVPVRQGVGDPVCVDTNSVHRRPSVSLPVQLARPWPTGLGVRDGHKAPELRHEVRALGRLDPIGLGPRSVRPLVSEKSSGSIRVAAIGASRGVVTQSTPRTKTVLSPRVSPEFRRRLGLSAPEACLDSHVTDYSTASAE